jgi:glutathione S-transferase
MASDKITLWGRGSGRTMRAHWMLREFGLEYDIKPIQSRTGETQTAEYTAINPKQKIPLLQHGNFVLTESPAIITYLAETFNPPHGFYVPRDQQCRAKLNEWCFFAAMELDAHTIYIIRRHQGLPEIYGEAPQAVASAKEYYKKQVNAVSSQVADAGTYLFGAEFSIADIMLTTCLDAGRRYEIELPEALVAYLNRVEKRPAYRQAFELNYHGLRKLKPIRR